MLTRLAMVFHGKLLAIAVAGVVLIGGGTAVAVAATKGALPVFRGAEVPTTATHTGNNDEHPDATTTPGKGEQGDDQHELHGTVGTISTGSFVLKPSTGKAVTVTVSSHTHFDDGVMGLSGLKAGEAVEVEGTLQADGTFAASAVETSGNDEHEADDQGAKDLHGTVASIGSNSFVLKVSGASDEGGTSGPSGTTLTVSITSTTTFKNLSGLGALKVGESVEVQGTLQADDTLTASAVVAISQGTIGGGD
jgi:hypothetical protein